MQYRCSRHQVAAAAAAGWLLDMFASVLDKRVQLLPGNGSALVCRRTALHVDIADDED